MRQELRSAVDSRSRSSSTCPFGQLQRSTRRGKSRRTSIRITREPSRSARTAHSRRTSSSASVSRSASVRIDKLARTTTTQRRSSRVLFDKLDDLVDVLLRQLVRVEEFLSGFVRVFGDVVRKLERRGAILEVDVKDVIVLSSSVGLFSIRSDCVDDFSDFLPAARGGRPLFIDSLVSLSSVDATRERRYALDEPRHSQKLF